MKNLLTVMLLTVLTAALSGCSGGMGGRMFSGCRLCGGNRGQQCNACYQQPTCCPAPVYNQSIPAYGGGCCGGQTFASPYQSFGSPCQSCGEGGMIYGGTEMPGMDMQGTIIQDGPIYGGDQIPVLPGPTPAPTTVPGPTTSPLNP